MQTNVTCDRKDCPLDYGDSEKFGVAAGKSTKCPRCGRSFVWKEKAVVDAEGDDFDFLQGEEPNEGNEARRE